jgi:hypothetical protein
LSLREIGISNDIMIRKGGFNGDKLNVNKLIWYKIDLIIALDLRK